MLAISFSAALFGIPLTVFATAGPISFPWWGTVLAVASVLVRAAGRWPGVLRLRDIRRNAATEGN